MTTELKPCPVTWHMRTEEEIAASALPELPDGKIYGWMTKGGTIYAGEGYPVPVRRFALDNDSCVALMIATAIRSLSNKTGEGSGGGASDDLRSGIISEVMAYAGINTRDAGELADQIMARIAASNKGGRDGE